MSAMKTKNLAFIDVETTGFDPQKHEIIEIGCVIARQTTGGLELIEELEIKVKPEHIETADQQALRINGYDEGQWIFASTLSEALTALNQKANNAVMVAHNVAFDWSFIGKAFTNTGIESAMHYAKIDSLTFALAKLYDKESVIKFSLGALCEYFGIKNAKAHTALADARATYEVYKKLLEI